MGRIAMRGLFALLLVATACSLEHEALIQELKESHSDGVNAFVEKAMAATENAAAENNDLGQVKGGDTETGIVTLVNEAEEATALGESHQAKYDDYSTEAKVDRARSLF